MSRLLLNKTINRYRDLLCNLSKRNRELYFKESMFTISLTKVAFSNDYKNKKNVLDRFVAASYKNEGFVTKIESGKINLTQHFFSSEESNKLLERKISRIRLIDDSYQKEFGISGGWFLGPFLLWKAKDMKNMNEILISPIFKIAIDINKSKAKEDELVFEGEKYAINPSLKLYLRKDFGIELEDEYEGEFKTVLELIKEKICSANIQVDELLDYTELIRIAPATRSEEDEDGNIIRKKINPDEFYNDVEKHVYARVSLKNFMIHDVFYIDHLSANKMSLYNDYEAILETENLNLIEDLVLTHNQVQPRSVNIDQIDSIPEERNFFVVDIDSSQHLAIQKSLSTNALVIQGPPGTGKSQTITNMIAQYMSAGKKVLFVSEKRAALDVVYARLNKANLSKQSVIIHSSDLNRKSLYQSFLDVLKETPCHVTDGKWRKVSAELDSSKKNLKDYYSSLKSIHKMSGKPSSEIFTMNSRYLKIGPRPALANFFKSNTLDQLEDMRSRIVEIETYFRSFPEYLDSPWFFKRSNFFLTEGAKYSLEENISNSLDQINQHIVVMKDFFGKFPNGDFENIKNIKPIDIHGFEKEASTALVNHYKDKDTFFSSVARIKEKLINLKRSFEGYAKIRDEADEMSVKALALYYAEPRGFIDWFTPSFWKMRKLKTFVVKPGFELVGNSELKQWLSFRSEKDQVDEILGDLKELCIIHTNENHQKSNDELGQNLNFTSIIVHNIRAIGGDRFSVSVKSNELENLCKDFLSLAKVVEKIDQIVPSLKVGFDYLSDVSGKVLEYSHEKLEEIYAEVELLNSSKDQISKVHKMKDLIATFEKDFKVSGFEKIIVSTLKDFTNWDELILAQSVKSWNDDILVGTPSFQNFNSTLFENSLEKIKSQYGEHQIVARESLNSILATMKASEQIAYKSIKVLEHEASKQKRIKSPREIMEQGALEAMLSIKRCWLMSPLSISQILPNVKDLFDVVIFDEASQVRIEDALPSIFRAKSLIVVGDNKQMPPTNFFGSASIDDEDEEVEMGESVLDQALKSYEDILLEWHYRSKYQALIAFSNYAFYDRKLIAAPNPGSLVAGEPIKFIQVQNAYFTSKTGNEVEAKAVAQRIREILVKDKKASIGVISLGMSQQKAIESELELLFESDAEFASALTFSSRYEEDGAFVGFINKNLENIQGDERNHIIISVGYARPKEGAKLRKVFGPLSMLGGGRRLNVAATRAKEKMEIFCSFDINELSTDEEAFDHNPESTTFARFLHYCKAISDMDSKRAQTILNLFKGGSISKLNLEVNFNLDIKKELEKRGYSVVANAGTCGFYIDLAIVDPNDPNTYVLGIECDAGIFHTSSYSRDRDKSRAFLLQTRGWKIHRVWSQNWSNDRENEIEKIIGILEEIKIIAA